MNKIPVRELLAKHLVLLYISLGIFVIGFLYTAVWGITISVEYSKSDFLNLINDYRIRNCALAIGCSIVAFFIFTLGFLIFGYFFEGLLVLVEIFLLLMTISLLGSFVALGFCEAESSDLNGAKEAVEMVLTNMSDSQIVEEWLNSTDCTDLETCIDAGYDFVKYYFDVTFVNNTLSICIIGLSLIMIIVSIILMALLPKEPDCEETMKAQEEEKQEEMVA